MKYRFCPKMDAVMATHVMATVKMVSACARPPLPSACACNERCRVGKGLV